MQTHSVHQCRQIGRQIDRMCISLQFLAVHLANCQDYIACIVFGQQLGVIQADIHSISVSRYSVYKYKQTDRQIDRQVGRQIECAQFTGSCGSFGGQARLYSLHSLWAAVRCYASRHSIHPSISVSRYSVYQYKQINEQIGRQIECAQLTHSCSSFGSKLFFLKGGSIFIKKTALRCFV